LLLLVNGFLATRMQKKSRRHARLSEGDQRPR
jgi:hypothetical protein